MTQIKKVHIGEEIEARMNELQLTKSDLARRIGVPKQNMNRLLEKNTIDTDKLVLISDALDFNFFTLFCQDEPPKVVVAHPDVTDHSAFSATGDVSIDDHRGGLDFSTKTKGDESELIQSLRDQIAILKNNLADKERIIKIYEGKD